MRVLVTGSSGLIGGEVVAYWCGRGARVVGIDNNMRQCFFGPDGDTRWNRDRLTQNYKTFLHNDIDIRNRGAVACCMEQVRPDLVVHAAAQPSHDLAAGRPFEDFDVNAVGTLNLLEAARKVAPETVFVYMSTNKVYGDGPNRIALRELESRWDYDDEIYRGGIPEAFSVDQCKHSLFGASKLAADVMVQEYGRYFNMRTCCLRGGCLTGPSHCGVELHGFLSYLVKVNVTQGVYRVFGYKGKQVRDNIHAFDVARFTDEFYQNPKSGAVYNIGGGRDNSCSILEAFDLVSDMTGKPMQFEYVDRPREADHICYYSDLRRIRQDYPTWNITVSLAKILEEIVSGWVGRLAAI